MCDHLNTWKNSTSGGEACAYFRVQRACLSLFKGSADSALPSGIACLSCGRCSGNREEHRQHCCPSGHSIGLDLRSVELYCGSCQDFIYDSHFDEAVAGAATSAGHGIKGEIDNERPKPRHLESLLESGESHFRRRSSGDDAGPSSESLLLKQARRVGGGDSMPAGLRGLINLGNTCFMSTVLHALLHAPLMRSFYLGGGHPHAACDRGGEKPCLSCELDAIFSAAYSGERKPYSPTSFLATWWQHADSLAGYRQQDAHEFYLFALSGLTSSRLTSTPTPSATSPAPGIKHEPEQVTQEVPSWNLAAANGIPHLHGGPKITSQEGLCGHAGAMNVDGGETMGLTRQESPAPRDDGPSAASMSSEREGEEEGIVERTFGGMLRSDVTCAGCGYTSTVYEPFLDISLDVGAPTALPPPLLRPTPAVSPASILKSGKKLVGAAAAAAAKTAARAARQASAVEASNAAVTGVMSAEASGTPELTPLATPVSTETSDLGCAFGSDQQATATGGRANGATLAPAMPPSREASGDENMTEGGRSNALEPSGLLTESTDGNSSVGAGSAVVPLPDTSRDESLSSPLQPPAFQPQHLPELSQAAPMPPPATSRPALKSSKPPAKRPKTTRCGECHTCRNKHLKKACLRNVELKRMAEEAERSRLAAEHMMQHGGLEVPWNHLSGSQLSQASAPQTSIPTQQPGVKHSHPTEQTTGMPAQQNGIPRIAQFTTGMQSPVQRQGVVCPQNQSPQHPPGSLLQQSGPQPGSIPQHAAPSSQAASQGVQRAVINPHNTDSGFQAGLAAGTPYVANGIVQRQQKPATAQPPITGGSGTVSGKPASAKSPKPSPCKPQQGTQYDRAAATGALTLVGCLRRYVRSEHLAKWLCERCHQRQAVKQVSIRRLPQVLCLHLKRFQHPGTQGIGRKVTTPLQFPVHLDMQPYLSSTVLKQRFAVRELAVLDMPATSMQSSYELYAVVCHKGNLQGGHYIAYVKCGESWFECDDHWVVEVEESMACSAQAYMLYYRMA